MPDVIADNLTPDEATGDPPADVATDSMAEENTYNDKGPLRKSTGKGTVYYKEIKTQCW